MITSLSGSQSSADRLALIAAIITTALLASLGFWQLDRAAEKQMQAERELALPPVNGMPDTPAPWQRVHVTGQWHPTAHWFLDNQVMQKRAGYIVLVPFLPNGSDRWLLVSRGWLAAPASRDALPVRAPVHHGSVVLTLRLRKPAPDAIATPFPDPLPQRWQRIQPAAAAELTGLPFYDVYAEQFSSDDTGYLREWPNPSHGIARHQGYAAQWFALALLVAALAVRKLGSMRHRSPDS